MGAPKPVRDLPPLPLSPFVPSQKMSMTPLHWAAHSGDTAAIDRLVRAGAEVNAAGRYGYTPLHDAAENGHAEAVEALARAGAEVSAVDEYGRTPLHWAASYGHAEAVEALALILCISSADACIMWAAAICFCKFSRITCKGEGCTAS